MTQQFTPGIFPREVKEALKKTLFIALHYVHNSILHNQKVEITQMCIDKWMDKQNILYTYKVM